MQRIVEFSLKYRVWVLFFFSLILAGGIGVASSLPVDAVPDITNIQVIVNVKTGGLDPQQVEKSVTFFIEAEMAGIPNVREVRSLSRFGLSQTVIIFEDGTDIYWARQQVGERISLAKEKIPQNLAVGMAPITTGLGEVFMYVLLLKPGSENMKLPEKERLVYLRTIQDFVVKPYLKSTVHGAADVDSAGGYEKNIHIDIDLEKMERLGVTLNGLITKLRSVGENYGGGYIEQRKEQVIVRTNGAFALSKLRELPIKLAYDGRHIRLKELAEINIYHSQRIGAATYLGEETVLGTLLMIMGQNSRRVALEAEAALKSAPLPDDVEARVVYTRSFLVGATVKTVAKNLAEGAALVIVIILAFLGNLRAAFFVALSIPFSMAIALLGMKGFGISANLMSLGALDFGLIVDGSIVMIENLISKMEKKPVKTAAERLRLVKTCALEVLAPLTTGLVIIMAVYLPILTLEGVEGKLYYPMAVTVLLALLGSLVMAIVVIPVLSSFLVGKKHHQAQGLSKIQSIYEPLLNFPLQHIRKLVPFVAVFIIACGILFARIGADFMPPLNEGDMTLNLLHDSRMSLNESLGRAKLAEKILSTYPEVETAFGRLGTSAAATDPMGVNLSDLFVILKKDTSLWRKKPDGKTISKPELFQIMKHDLKAVLEKTEAMGESELVETQPISMRFNELLEGSRADISLRIYGKDLNTLMDLQKKVTEMVRQIPGAAQVELDALTALRKSSILSATVRYDRINYYGIPLNDVNETLQTALVGRHIGSYYEEDWRFPVDIIIDDEQRKNPELIKKIPVALPEGGTIRLGELADLSYSDNVTSIARSALKRYAGVAIYLGDRDTQSFVAEAQSKIKTELKLPTGYHLHWGGQFKNLERAKTRLTIIVPIILAAIAFLVYRTFRSVRQTLLIFLTIPFAWTGGILALTIAGLNFSVSAAVGFIALSGVAVLNGLVKVSYLNQLVAEGHGVAEAVKIGALGRLRPVLMTASVASLGFLPMVLNSGIGAEVQKPLAVVVLGGLITATLMTLFLLPAFYLHLEKKRV